jgi:hypothetical protein
MFEACFDHGAFGGSAPCISGAAADRLRRRFTPLPLARWYWLTTTFYARDGALLLLNENDDRFDAWVVALHRDGLAHIEDLVDDHWAHVGF